MHDRRWIIEAELELLTPLHIGSGESEADGRLTPPGSNEPPEVARIIRDHENKPWIPPTTLKGLLRDAARREGEDERFKRLFGEIKDAGRGRMARLTTYGMSMSASPQGKIELPHCEAATGVFISAHTAIDDATGTADEHKLYHREMMAPGAKFRMRLAYAPPRGDDGERVRIEKEKEDLRLLGRLLGAFAAEEGVGFGRGRQDANGRMRLKEGTRPELKLKALNDNGDLVEQTPPENLKKAFEEGLGKPLKESGTVWELTLTQDEYSGPFLVADGVSEKSADDANVITPLKRDENTPHVPGESFMGALRARAEWLAALKEMRDDIARGEGRKIIETLFGQEAKAGGTGARGKLGLRRLDVSEGDIRKFTSVALDRFSGAPFGQALFETEGFVGVKCNISLALDAGADDEARDFVEELVADLEETGLTLGHGEARGFGWFEVKKNDADT